MDLRPPTQTSAPCLRRNVAWSLVGMVGLAGSQWGMFVLLARWTSEQIVGQLALALAVTTPLFTLTNLQLRSLIATDPEGRFLPSEYGRLRRLGIAVAVLLCLATMWVLTPHTESRVIIVLIMLGQVADAWSDLLYGFDQRAERMDRLARSQMTRGGVSLLAGACGAAAPFAPAVICATCYSLGRWVTLLLYDLRSQPGQAENRSTLPWSATQTQRLWNLFRLGLPLGVATLLVSLDLTLVRVFVQLHEGERGLGLFAASAHFLLLGGLAFNAVGQSLAPRLARYVQEGRRREFYRLWGGFLGRTILVSTSLAVLVTLWGKSLLSWVYGTSYAVGASTLVWLIWGGMLRDVSAPFGYALTSMRCLRAQPINLAISALVVLTGCWLLVPSRGLMGAAQAFLAGMLAKLLGMVLLICLADRHQNWTAAREAVSDGVMVDPVNLRSRAA